MKRAIHKSHFDIAKRLIERPRFLDGCRYNTGTHWSPIDRFQLEVLCEAEIDIEAAADTLGRKETTLAHKASECLLPLPPQWARLIRPKKKAALRPATEPLMAYPYIAKAKPENADLRAINAVVPANIPEHMRADICQEIMLAVLEGRTTLEQLQQRGRGASYFIRKFWKENYEQAGHALSFSVEDERSYDEAAASIAAKEWRHSQLVEQHRHVSSIMMPFSPPTQFEAAWRDQIGGVRMALDQMGHYLSHEEAEELLSDEC